MSVLISGRHPKTEAGECLEFPTHLWVILWMYCYQIAPRIWGKPQRHRGPAVYKFNQADSEALARQLREELKSGRTAAYKAGFDTARKTLLNEACPFCAGTGRRKPSPDFGAGSELCNDCRGQGMCPPEAARDRFPVSMLVKFVEFLENCGGCEMQ